MWTTQCLDLLSLVLLAKLRGFLAHNWFRIATASRRSSRYLLIWEFVCLSVLIGPVPTSATSVFTGNSSLALPSLPLALDDTTRLTIRS